MPTVKTERGTLEFRDPPWVPTQEEIDAFRRARPDDAVASDLLDRLVRAHRLRVDQLTVVADTLADVGELSEHRRIIALAALATAELDVADLPEEQREALRPPPDDHTTVIRYDSSGGN